MVMIMIRYSYCPSAVSLEINMWVEIIMISNSEVYYRNILVMIPVFNREMIS